jgi:hypothetical protein
MLDYTLVTFAPALRFKTTVTLHDFNFMDREMRNRSNKHAIPSKRMRRVHPISRVWRRTVAVLGGKRRCNTNESM